MSRKDFLVMLGANAGLQIDYNNGTMVGKRNDFNVFVDLSSGTKIYVTCVRRDEPMDDSDKGAALSKLSCVNNITVNKHTVCFECNKIPHNKEGANELSGMIFSVTEFLKTNYYEDRSDVYPEETEFEGKSVGMYKGETVASSALLSAVGVIAGAFLGFMIIYLVSSSAPVIGRFLTGAVFVLLPIIGFEMMKTRKSVFNVAILLVGLLVSGCVYARINKAAEIKYNLDRVSNSYTANAVNDVIQAFGGPRIEFPTVTLDEAIDEVPHVWEATGEYLTTYIIVLSVALVLFVLAVFNYYRDRQSIFSIFVDIYQVLFLRNR